MHVAGGRPHDELIALAQHDHQAARAHQRAAALGDQLEHRVEQELPADRHRHVARGLQPAHRALELLAAMLADFEQARVVDRDGRPVGEDDGGLLVLLGELAVSLLGEVEVAPGLAADRDRHAEESAHHRMAGREAVAARMIAHVAQAQRLGMFDQHAEHAASARQVADRGVRGLVHARGQELGELGATVVEDPQRGVTGAGDLACRLQHPVQQRVEVELCD